MIRVVFDTVVFVRALLNRRGLWARLVFERAGEYRLVVSSPVVREALGVLRRPELARRFSTLPGRDPAAVLAVLAEADQAEVGAAPIPRVARDPNDDVFLATARAGGAAYIVTEDDDLLVLGMYEGIRIVDAAAFLRVLDEIGDGETVA
ncbi:MAG: putative toxin-antitoxin system toxin component, PIN family [Chloroflexota bacterium]|nr:putative toxin-antitoxin system toxin component, PIN family [Chloroflexota bacterium]